MAYRDATHLKIRQINMETEIKATAMAKVEKRINFKDIVSVLIFRRNDRQRI